MLLTYAWAKLGGRVNAIITRNCCVWRWYFNSFRVINNNIPKQTNSNELSMVTNIFNTACLPVILHYKLKFAIWLFLTIGSIRISYICETKWTINNRQFRRPGLYGKIIIRNLEKVLRIIIQKKIYRYLGKN